MASAFAGYHRRGDDDSFVVFRVDDKWYWQLVVVDKDIIPRGMVNGPFPEAEGAYLAAIGE